MLEPTNDAREARESGDASLSYDADVVPKTETSIYDRDPELDDDYVARRLKAATVYANSGMAYAHMLQGTGTTPEEFDTLREQRKAEADKITNEAKEALGRDLDITSLSLGIDNGASNFVADLTDRLKQRGITIDLVSGAIREYGSPIRHVYLDGMRLSAKQLVWWQKTGKIVQDRFIKKINAADGLAAVNLRLSSPHESYQNHRFRSPEARDEYLRKQRAIKKAKRDDDRAERLANQVDNRIAAYAFMDVTELKYALKLCSVRARSVAGEIDLLRYIIELRNGWERYSPCVIKSINSVINGDHISVYSIISDSNWLAMEAEYVETLYMSPFRHYFEQKVKIAKDRGLTIS